MIVFGVLHYLYHIAHRSLGAKEFVPFNAMLRNLGQDIVLKFYF